MIEAKTIFHKAGSIIPDVAAGMSAPLASMVGYAALMGLSKNLFPHALAVADSSWVAIGASIPPAIGYVAGALMTIGMGMSALREGIRSGLQARGEPKAAKEAAISSLKNAKDLGAVTLAGVGALGGMMALGEAASRIGSGPWVAGACVSLSVATFGALGWGMMKNIFATGALVEKAGSCANGCELSNPLNDPNWRFVENIAIRMRLRHPEAIANNSMTRKTGPR